MTLENENRVYTPKDFPDCWLPLDTTVEVEAKAKEPAVLKLKKGIEKFRKKMWKVIRHENQAKL